MDIGVFSATVAPWGTEVVVRVNIVNIDIGYWLQSLEDVLNAIRDVLETLYTEGIGPGHTLEEPTKRL